MLAAVVSCRLYFYNRVWQAFAVLIGAAAVDYLLYRILPDVTICYRCHSQYWAQLDTRATIKSQRDGRE